jgi:hypothetical protein
MTDTDGITIAEAAQQLNVTLPRLRRLMLADKNEL